MTCDPCTYNSAFPEQDQASLVYIYEAYLKWTWSGSYKHSDHSSFRER